MNWGAGSPPPVIVRTSYGRGWAVRLCWPLGPDLSTRRYRTTVIQCKPVCFGRSGAVFMVTVTMSFLESWDILSSKLTFYSEDSVTRALGGPPERDEGKNGV
ncbi:hypothetical protein AVEN_63222-1 [Araneus ventricosus]|uniref:Uncharacterized protein n=1 Tax=Araneus ventricosus TaxID=182803 RepID=A0A4Y2B251_ARAVE|nr:hypothetical protein AVEN_63222-1 [Araneus ventricosus]